MRHWDIRVLCADSLGFDGRTSPNNQISAHVIETRIEKLIKLIHFFIIVKHIDFVVNHHRRPRHPIKNPILFEKSLSLQTRYQNRPKGPFIPIVADVEEFVSVLPLFISPICFIFALNQVICGSHLDARYNIWLNIWTILVQWYFCNCSVVLVSIKCCIFNPKHKISILHKQIH